MKSKLKPANKIIQRKILESIENARKPKGERFRHQLYVFVICLAISIFMWVLVRLGNDYIYTVNYHLKYSGVPDNFTLIGASDSIATVNIRVQGFDFFTERFFRSRKRYIDIDLRDSKLHFLDNYQTGYLLISSITDEITTQTNFPLEINSISPDTLFFAFERRNPKRISMSKQTLIPTGHLSGKADTFRMHIDSVINKPIKAVTKK